MIYNVSDDAMAGDRICKGDLVRVERSFEFNPNDILLLKIGKCSKLRRVLLSGKYYTLIPSNPKFKQEFIHSSELEPIGKAIEVFARVK